MSQRAPPPSIALTSTLAVWSLAFYLDLGTSLNLGFINYCRPRQAGDPYNVKNIVILIQNLKQTPMPKIGFDAPPACWDAAGLHAVWLLLAGDCFVPKGAPSKSFC